MMSSPSDDFFSPQVREYFSDKGMNMAGVFFFFVPFSEISNRVIKVVAFFSHRYGRERDAAVSFIILVG